MKDKSILFRSLLFILITGFLAACEKDKDEDREDILVGTWNSSTATFDATVNNKPLLQYYIDEGFTSTDAQSAVNFFNLLMQQTFSGSITFNADKTYTTNLGGQNDTGVWSLSSDGNQITIDSNTEPPFNLEVESLSNNELVVSWQESGQEDLNEDTVPENINVNVNMRFTK